MNSCWLLLVSVCLAAAQAECRRGRRRCCCVRLCPWSQKANPPSGTLFTVVLRPQEVNSDTASRLPVLFLPRPAAAAAGSQPPPQQRLPQALVDAMASANAALLAVWTAKHANDANKMAVQVHSTLIQVRAWAPASCRRARCQATQVARLCQPCC